MYNWKIWLSDICFLRTNMDILTSVKKHCLSWRNHFSNFELFWRIFHFPHINPIPIFKVEVHINRAFSVLSTLTFILLRTRYSFEFFLNSSFTNSTNVFAQLMQVSFILFDHLHPLYPLWIQNLLIILDFIFDNQKTLNGL